jgi:hypothetical protein
MTVEAELAPVHVWNNSAVGTAPCNQGPTVELAWPGGELRSISDLVDWLSRVMCDGE